MSGASRAPWLVRTRTASGGVGWGKWGEKVWWWSPPLFGVSHPHPRPSLLSLSLSLQTSLLAPPWHTFVDRHDHAHRRRVQDYKVVQLVLAQGVQAARGHLGRFGQVPGKDADLLARRV